MTDKVELAYFAGFVDGDGSFMIVKERRRAELNPQIQIANKNREVLDEFKSIFGGSLIPRRQGNRRWFQLTLSSFDEIISAVRALKPYLKIKIKQAELLLKFCRARRRKMKHGARNAAYNETELKIYREVKELNKAGRGR